MTVLVVTFNSSDFIERCLKAADGLGAAEILICDNSSSDDTLEVIGGLELNSAVRVVRSAHNQGFGSANNRLMLHCKTPYALMLNPDCVAEPLVVDALLKQMEDDPLIGVAAPLMALGDGSQGVAGGGRPSVLKEVAGYTRLDERMPASLRSQILRGVGRLMPDSAVGQYARSSQPAADVVDMFWVSGFCMVVRSAAFERAGGFDESFFLYFEDVDLCERLRVLGFRSVLVRHVSALHFESMSSASERQKSSHYFEGMKTYFDRHGSPWERGVASMLRRVAG